MNSDRVPPSDPATVKAVLGTVGEAMLLSDVQATALLGDSRAHFRNLVRLGLAPRGLKCGHLTRWRRQELIDWINSGMPPVTRWHWGGKR